MKIIKSTRDNYDILVDDEDYQRVVDFADNGWEVRFFTKSNNPYAVTRKTIEVNGVKKRKQYLMHRLILNVLDSKLPHIDHKKQKSTLDNQKSNLRFVTRRENMKNRTSKKTSYCKYLGVSYCESKRGSKKYRVNIQDENIKKGNIHLGYYYDEDSAGYAYNLAAEVIHGEFANLNVVDMDNVVNANEIRGYIQDVLNNLNMIL